MICSVLIRQILACSSWYENGFHNISSVNKNKTETLSSIINIKIGCNIVLNERFMFENWLINWNKSIVEFKLYINVYVMLRANDIFFWENVNSCDNGSAIILCFLSESLNLKFAPHRLIAEHFYFHSIKSVTEAPIDSIQCKIETMLIIAVIEFLLWKLFASLGTRTCGNQQHFSPFFSASDQTEIMLNVIKIDTGSVFKTSAFRIEFIIATFLSDFCLTTYFLEMEKKTIDNFLILPFPPPCNQCFQIDLPEPFICNVRKRSLLLLTYM